jgi:hypothetical protein
MTNRPGAASVAELVLVAWLFALVLAGIARFATDQNRLAGLQRDRVRYQEAARTGHVVLGAELRFTAPGDVAATARDSVRLRAFRGGGHLCALDEESVRVLYQGVRQPDPVKDSVLFVGPDAVEVHRLESARASSDCGGSLHFLLDGSVPTGAVYVLVFETGTYVLADGAVRYRRGASGRQPLTEPVLWNTEFQGRPDGLGIRFHPHPDSLPRLAGRPWGTTIRSLNEGVLP